MFPIMGATNPTGYNLTRSLRFRSSASAYLSRTPASAGNRQTWTWSGWVKRGSLGSAQFLMCAGSTSIGVFGFLSDDTLFFNFEYTSNAFVTTQVFRDPSAWYHIVVVADTTNATAANRTRLYVNGTQVTAFSATSYPAQNNQGYVNINQIHTIARRSDSSSSYFDGYLTEVNFIDGQALTPSSFGSTNTLTGVWQPARYTGTYGTNGFYLPFTDNSALTTSSNVGLGKDFSGNGNYWATNNISITSGVTYDSMTDVPTLTSPTVANFATLNPIGVPYNTGTASGGNLNWTGASTANKGMAGTIAMSSGKWYWECVITATAAGSSSYVGIVKTAGSADSNANRVYLQGDGLLVKYGTATGPYTTFTTGDIVGVAYDYSAQTLSFYKNNTLNVTVTGINLESNLPWVGGYTTTESWSINFGQRPFTYTPPTGFVALNTFNLPTSTILKGNTSMNAVTWSGATTGTNLNVTGFGFQPDFVWGKNRSGTYDHFLQDSVRGITNGLSSNLTAAESTTSGSPTSFISDGFNISSTAGWSSLGNSNVTWAWKESASAGFDIVTFTGNGGGQTFAHNLGVAPGLMICKSRNNAQDWYVYHSSIGGTGALSLNTTAGTATSVSYWSNVTPSSSTFSVGGNFSNGYTYVNYLFAPIAGYSAFGSYVGNGVSTGPFIYCGFQPRWILIKSTTSARSWCMWDTARNPYNLGTAGTLFAESSSAEYSGGGAYTVAVTSNGFYLPVSTPNLNGTGETMVYAAFATSPFKNSLAF